MSTSTEEDEIESLEFIIESVKYNDNFINFLFFDIRLGWRGCIKIHQIEVHRREKDGYLEIDLPYRESFLNFQKTPSISFFSYDYVEQLRKALENWLKENIEFDNILRRKCEFDKFDPNS